MAKETRHYPIFRFINYRPHRHPQEWVEMGALLNLVLKMWGLIEFIIETLTLRNPVKLLKGEVDEKEPKKEPHKTEGLDKVNSASKPDAPSHRAQ